MVIVIAKEMLRRTDYMPCRFASSTPDCCSFESFQSSVVCEN
jgi:hypothetical protein